METKKDIRTRLLLKRDAFPEEACQTHSRAVEEKLFAHPRYAQCRKLFSYVSFRKEVDTFGIMERALRDGKVLAVPRVSGKQMEFYEIQALSELREGTYGILEPTGEVKAVPEEGDLILLPGAAFDRAGNRIGYGGGYYDRYLEKYPYGYTIALAYEFQVMDALSAETHDRRADEIVFG